MKKKRILIVEDSIDQIRRYRDIAQLSMEVSIATTIEEAHVALNRDAIDVLLSDIHLSKSSEQKTFEGFELIEYVGKNFPEVLIIAMSADPKIEVYNKSYTLGARYFLKKPIVNEAEIAIAIESAEQARVFERVSRSLPKEAKVPEHLAERCKDGLVLDQSIRKTIRGVAKVKDIPVVILGETGTGKEEVAKLIHANRVEVEGPMPFVAVNCANLDNSTALSILFGHKKGSFTGANDTTLGLVGEANGGILFLDEIHRLNDECQARLLRVLNDGSYQRFGDTKQLSSHFQVLVASTKDLDLMVEEGSFLMDLRSRITGVDIQLDPLRDRKDDMAILIPLYFAKQRIEISDQELGALIEKCQSYYWQGNIRQLFNVLKSLTTMSIMNEEPVMAARMPEFKTMLAPHEKIKGIAAPPKDLAYYEYKDKNLKEVLEAVEKTVIEASLKDHRKLADAIAALGISRSSLDLKRKKYNI